MARLSIPDEQTHATFTVTTSTSAFPISFSLFEKADLRVSVDGEELDQSDFSFTGTLLDGGGYDGGTVTLNNAVDDVEVIIWRHVAPVRASNFAPSASVPVQSVDQAFNRLTAVGQDLHYLKLDAPKNPTAGSYLAYDAALNVVTSSGTGADAGLRTDLAASAGTSLVGYDDGENDTVAVSMQEYLRSMPIYAIAYGVTPDGTDKSAELKAVLAAADASGREIILPPGTLRFDSPTTAYLTQALSYKTAFRKGLRMRGAGSGRTIIDTRAASNPWLYITVGDGAGGEHDFATYAGGLGGHIEGMTIINGAATTASDGIRIRSQVQFRFRDLHIIVSGTGIKSVCSEGDLDGNNQVLFEDVRVEDCGGWGIDAGADDGHNENSFMTFNRVFVQNCGTAEQRAITGITQANPGVVTTSTAHGLTTGDEVFIVDVGGMTEVSTHTSEVAYTVTVLSSTTFSIGVNTTGYTAYTSGGYMLPRTPSSGGVRIKGQITTFQSCGWTINKNRSVWIDGTGGGLPSDVFFYDSTIENPQGIGLHVQGNRGLTANGLHLYFNADQAGGPAFWGHLYDGLTAVVSDIHIRCAVPRTTDAAGEQSVHCFHTIGANAHKDSIRIDPATLHVKQFGFPGQVMFKGISFDPIPQECRLIVNSATELRLRPDPSYPLGNRMPVRARFGGATGATYSTGPWMETRLSSSGVAISNSGLANSTLYYVYLYAAASILNTPTLELSTTAPTLDSTGYPVKTGDATRLCVTDPLGTPARVATDGSGQFVTSGAAYLAPNRFSGDGVGAPSWAWFSQTDRKLYFKTGSSLPTFQAAGEYSYWPTYEASATYDPPSLAAGASTTTTLAATCALGDYVKAVSFSVDQAGVVMSGYVSAANVITVVLTNTTGSAVDLASGTLRATYERR